MGAGRVRGGGGRDAEERWPESDISALLNAAQAAPRLASSRGWWVECEDQAILLRTDLTPDRAGKPGLLRRTRITAGAALFGMRLTVARRGHRPHVALQPDPTRPGVLAVLRRGRPDTPSPFHRQLYALLGTSDVRAVEVDDAAALYALRRAAGAEGTWSRTTSEPAEVVGSRLRDQMPWPHDGPTLYVTLGAEGEPATADLRIGLAMQQMLLTAAVLGRRAQVSAMSFDAPGTHPNGGPPRLLLTLESRPAAARRAPAHRMAPGAAESTDSRPA
ncbi:hypothetical protein [Pseudonocardia sp.]|uniref:hypothetical protein n=1 Tax=Pseudonocardia sp. TaxID=60912 RepID=UPI003D1198CB